jgi:L-asparagine oxygenase
MAPATDHLTASPKPIAQFPVEPFTLPAPPRDATNDEFVRAAGHASRLLPATVHDALVDFTDDSGEHGALLLTGMPVGDLPATPARPDAAVDKDPTSEMTLLTVARRLGQPVGYVQEHGGGIVQNIVPARDDERRQLSTSSSVTLEWHTETAFHPHKPRYLLLLCLRADPHARTLLSSVAHLLPALGDDAVRTLREPRFRARPDASFLAADASRPGELGPLMPVITPAEPVPSFTYDGDLMIGVDADAQSALDRLGELVRSHASSISLESGDLLVVDNLRTVHARSAFRARYDGSDRWLQRAFVVSDLAPSATERTGRIITTRF